MRTPRVAAGALSRDTAGRVLLVRPTYKRAWDVPGGYVTPGEPPLAACRRELAEELARSWPVQPLVVDGAPAPNEGDKILFVFDGGILPDGALESATFADGETGGARRIETDESDTTRRCDRRPLPPSAGRDRRTAGG